MPKLGTDLIHHNAGYYGYSAIRIDDLESSGFTLVVIATDVSSSVESFKTEMEQSIKSIVDACKSSPRADNLLIRFVSFAHNLEEIHGFKLLEQCNTSDYDNSLKVGGNTALYDAIENAVSSVADWGQQIASKKYLDINAIVFVITDGQDNCSKSGAETVKKILKKAVMDEHLESIMTVLIGVGVTKASGMDQYLSDVHTNVGFTQYVAIDDSSAKSLAKLAQFVSKSISAQSQSLGSGGSSIPLNI